MVKIARRKRGRRLGENHQNAKLTDDEVLVVLELRDDGFSYQWIADKFGVSKSCIRWICTGRNRCQFIVSVE